MFVCLFVCLFARARAFLVFVAAYFRAFLCRTLNMGQALHFSPTGSSSLVNTQHARAREREKEKKKERLNKKNVQLRFISVAIREGGS